MNTSRCRCRLAFVDKLKNGFQGPPANAESSSICQNSTVIWLIPYRPPRDNTVSSPVRIRPAGRRHHQAVYSSVDCLLPSSRLRD